MQRWHGPRLSSSTAAGLRARLRPARLVLVVYVVGVVAGSAVWEAAQTPLYTLWSTGTGREIAVDVTQCTAVNAVIAVVSLLGAVMLVGGGEWPQRRYFRCALVTCLLSVGYTMVSELINVYVTHTWAYSDLMPIVPGVGVGLAPVVQWVFLPGLALLVAHRVLNRRGSPLDSVVTKDNRVSVGST